MADIVSIGIAYDTSQLTTGTRQVQGAMQVLTQAEQQATSASETLARSSTHVAQELGKESQEAQRATTGLQRLEQAAGSAGRQVGALSGSLSTFGQQVGAFALAQAGVLGFQQALSTVQTALADVVRTGIQMSQLRGSFTAITGSVSAGSREFQFAVSTANRLGLELQSVAEQYRSLSAATRGTTLAGNDTRALFVALSNAAQAYGLSTEQLGRALTAFQQIISKGKVSQEELRQQLAEAIPGAVQIAARAYGTNTAALETMIDKGLEASDFIRRFTAQLASETPPAAERAGKGIAQLGNEILLLKNYIAQSGLLAWLDSAAGKAAAVARGLREIEEARRGQAEAGTAGTLGPGVTLDKLAADDRQKLLDVTGKLLTAEQELAGIQAARQQKAFGLLTPLITTAGAEVEAKARIEALRAEQAEIARSATLRSQEAQRAAARQKEITDMTRDERALTRDKEAANTQLKTSLDAAKTSQDALNKSAALAPELYGKATGTLTEQNTLLQERIKINEKALETATKAIVERRQTAGAVPGELVARQEALRKAVRDDTEALERNKQAIQDNEKARTKALQDAERVRKDLAQAKEEERRKDEQQDEEVRRTHQQNIEALRTLAGRYTEVRAARDEDRASTLAAALATSRYAEEARGLADAIAKVQRVEAKLPALRSEAAASAGRLTDINRLMTQFEPRRRGESTEERLTRSYAELANAPGVTMGKLSEASAAMQGLLATEQWDKWRTAGEKALSSVTDALTQFVTSGKGSFKDLLGSISADIFRMSTQVLLQQATKKGGWLEGVLDLGIKALGLVGGGMPTSGLLPTTEAAYSTMAAAGAFSGRQSGGPVWSGEPYWVGERGPELFVPPMSGTVLPTTGTATGQPPVVVNVTFNTTDAQSFIRSKGEWQGQLISLIQRSTRNA